MEMSKKRKEQKLTRIAEIEKEYGSVNMAIEELKEYQKVFSSVGNARTVRDKVFEFEAICDKPDELKRRLESIPILQNEIQELKTRNKELENEKSSGNVNDFIKMEKKLAIYENLGSPYMIEKREKELKKAKTIIKELKTGTYVIKLESEDLFRFKKYVELGGVGEIRAKLKTLDKYKEHGLPREFKKALQELEILAVSLREYTSLGEIGEIKLKCAMVKSAKSGDIISSKKVTELKAYKMLGKLKDLQYLVSTNNSLKEENKTLKEANPKSDLKEYKQIGKVEEIREYIRILKVYISVGDIDEFRASMKAVKDLGVKVRKLERFKEVNNQYKGLGSAKTIRTRIGNMEKELQEFRELEFTSAQLKVMIVMSKRIQKDLDEYNMYGPANMLGDLINLSEEFKKDYDQYCALGTPKEVRSNLRRLEKLVKEYGLIGTVQFIKDTIYNGNRLVDQYRKFGTPRQIEMFRQKLRLGRKLDFEINSILYDGEEE